MIYLQYLLFSRTSSNIYTRRIRSKGYPLGLQIIGKAFDEQNIFNIAYSMEEKINFKNEIKIGGCNVKKSIRVFNKKNNNEYEVVIGLEVHAQVLSESKLSLVLQQNLGQSLIHR